MKTTVFSITKHCTDAGEVIETLTGIGIGRGAAAHECNNIALSGGPHAAIYRDAYEQLRRPLNSVSERIYLG